MVTTVPRQAIGSHLNLDMRQERIENQVFDVNVAAPACEALRAMREEAPAQQLAFDQKETQSPKGKANSVFDLVSEALGLESEGPSLQPDTTPAPPQPSNSHFGHTR